MCNYEHLNVQKGIKQKKTLQIAITGRSDNRG
jgi:hypothetical protein